MQECLGRQQVGKIKSPDKACLTRVIAIAIVASVCSSGFVQAQSGKLGAYSGTINVSGTEINPRVSYRASVKVSLPVTQRERYLWLLQYAGKPVGTGYPDGILLGLVAGVVRLNA
ncbi:MAG: hypothetical protein HZC23_00905 [Rhodocyclales bacterium]|nr:hypothetical protein [Rhodocyclales bacterium]